MTRWVAIFEDKPEMLEIRARKDLRDAHIEYVKNHSELLIGGGLKQDTDNPFCGALWVVEAKNKSEVERLILGDPFYFSEYRSFQIFAWGKILEDQVATL
jgi:uncharacterized protein YciI